METSQGTDPMVDKDTRYYIDIDLKSKTILNWGSGQRQELTESLNLPFLHRIFISKGQFNKLKTAEGKTREQ